MGRNGRKTQGNRKKSYLLVIIFTISLVRRVGQGFLWMLKYKYYISFSNTDSCLNMEIFTQITILKSFLIGKHQNLSVHCLLCACL